VAPFKTPVDHVGAIERSLLLLVRRMKLPRTHEVFAGRAGVNVEPGALIVLARLDELGPVRPSELARLLGVEPSTATRHVQDLDRRVLVTKQPDPTDGRSCVVELTDEGRRALNQFRAARRRMLEDLLASWDPDELDQLARGLEHLVDDLTRLTEPTRAE
jgi:DNA-binding MarR family transcriptional regulator